MVHEPFDRALVAPGEAGFDLRTLFRDVDVDGAVRCQGSDGGEFLRGDGAQAVRSDAQGRVQGFQGFQQAGVAVGGVEEAALASVGGTPPKFEWA